MNEREKVKKFGREIGKLVSYVLLSVGEYCDRNLMEQVFIRITVFSFSKILQRKSITSRFLSVGKAGVKEIVKTVNSSGLKDLLISSDCIIPNGEFVSVLHKVSFSVSFDQNEKRIELASDIDNTGKFQEFVMKLVNGTPLIVDRLKVGKRYIVWIDDNAVDEMVLNSINQGSPFIVFETTEAS